MYGSVLSFVAGVAVGAFVSIVYMDVKKDKKPTDTSATENKEDGKVVKFHEKSSIDDYKTFSEEERTEYDTFASEYDPAESESPEEESIEELHGRYKGAPPTIISEEEYGTFGYETCELFFDPDRNNTVWEPDGDSYDDMEVHTMFADLLESSGFEYNDAENVLFIRNHQMQTDYKVIKSPGYL